MPDIISLQVRWTGKFYYSFRFFRIHLLSWNIYFFPLKRKMLADYPKFSECQKARWEEVSNWWTQNRSRRNEIGKNFKIFWLVGIEEKSNSKQKRISGLVFTPFLKWPIYFWAIHFEPKRFQLAGWTTTYGIKTGNSLEKI